MRSPIGYGQLEPAYPDETLKRGGKAKRKTKRATVDKSIKINIRNVQQQQRDIVHVMKGQVPPTPNIMPNSSRVFSAPSIHYALPQPQYYGNAPSVTQPLSVMKDISTQRNVPKKDPEPETVWDNNPAGIISGVDYSVRAQPKSEERKYQDAMADMSASKSSAYATEPFENEEDNTEAIVRQHDAVNTGPSIEAGSNPLFAGLTRLPARPPKVSATRKKELEELASPNRIAFANNVRLIDTASRIDLDNLLRNYLYITPETARQGNTDYLKGLIRGLYVEPAQASSSESEPLRRGGSVHTRGKGGELISALQGVSASAFPGFGSWLGEQLGNEYAKHTRGRGGIMPVAKSGWSTFASMF